MNASTDFRVITKRDSKWWTIAYAKGKKTQDLTPLTHNLKNTHLFIKLARSLVRARLSHF